MSLKHSYSIIAPIYDLFVASATKPLRQASINEFEALLKQSEHCQHTAQNDPGRQCKVLISGIGSGLDIPHLPVGPDYTGVDITPNMLSKAKYRNQQHDVSLELGDVMALPYENDSFHFIIMHLILAVVPNPQQALKEMQRVLKPNGFIFIADKFLRPKQFAPVRKVLSPLIGKIATQTNVVFEETLEICPQLKVVSDQPALAGGWFRRIVLQKFVQ